jgi:hypothetical protein
MIDAFGITYLKQTNSNLLEHNQGIGNFYKSIINCVIDIYLSMIHVQSLLKFIFVFEKDVLDSSFNPAKF